MTTKPSSIPRWADVGGAITDPPAAKKNVGWILNEKPPNEWFNWWMNLVGEGVKFWDAHLFDGATDDDFTVSGVDNTGTDVDGGDVVLRGGNATGDGSSFAAIYAAVAGAAGTAVRTSEEFLKADGALDRIVSAKKYNPIVIEPTSDDVKALEVIADTSLFAAAIFDNRNNRTVPAIRSINTGASDDNWRDVLEVKAETSGDMIEGFGPRLQFVAEDDSSGNILTGAIQSVRSTYNDNDWFLHIFNDVNYDPPIIIDTSGYIGIALNDPFKDLDAALQVRGNIYPDNDNAYDLGDSGDEWRRVFAFQFICGTGTIEWTERGSDSTPAANQVRMYAKDVGGKTALFAKFNTGAAQQIAIEP